jgi:putative endonuclease
MTWLLRLATKALRQLQGVMPKRRTAHLRTGREGETAAYLFLREQGYRIVATNFRTPRNRGEIDLIAWDGEVLCFLEVKTRVGEGLLPPEASVDTAKKEHIRSVARSYLRRLPGNGKPSCRFDVVSVTYPTGDSKPEIRLIQGAFHWKAHAPHPPRPFAIRPRRGPWQPRR